MASPAIVAERSSYRNQHGDLQSTSLNQKGFDLLTRFWLLFCSVCVLARLWLAVGHRLLLVGIEL